MEKLIVCFCVCSLTITTSLEAQSSDFELNLAAGHLTQGDLNHGVLKVGLDLFLSESVSLNWNLAIGVDGELEYGRVTGGLRLAGWALTGLDDYDDDCQEDENGFNLDPDCDDDLDEPAVAVGVAILSSLLPSTLALHVYPLDMLRLSPYISPVNFTYAPGQDGDTRFLFSSNAGVKLALGTSPRMRLVADLGIERIHDSGKYGLFSGAGISIAL